MRTRRKYPNNIYVRLNGVYEGGRTVRYKIIGYVYDRKFGQYWYDLMTEDRRFVIREERYIERYIV